MSTTMIAPRRGSAERRFYTGMAAAMLVTVVIGFAPTFFLRPLFPDTPAPPETIFTVHGVLFSAWIVLLLVQTALVGGGRTDLHRTVGAVGAVLAPAMVVLGTIAALVAARRAGGFIGVPVPPLQFLAVPLFDMLLFGSFVALGLANRHNPQTHKRWMLLASISLLTAAIARWPGVLDLGPPAFFLLTDLFIVALALWDRRSLRRLHPVTLWGGLALVVSQPLRLLILGTDAWLVFARWATELLG